MKIQYDAEVDALYIEFRPLQPGEAENRELSEDIVANIGPDGKLAGLEILNAGTVLAGEINKVIVEVSPVQHSAV